MVSKTKKGDLMLRTAASATAIICVTLLLAVAHMGAMAYFVMAVSAAVIAGALWEYMLLARAKGFRPLMGVGIAAAVGYVAASFMATQRESWLEIPPMVIALAMVVALLCRFRRIKGAMGDVAVTLLGLVYVVATLSCWLRILYGFPAPTGTHWIIYLIVVTKLSDMGAYFVGMAFGKHRMAPRLSPAKTIEGLFGGIVLAILGSLCFVYFGLVGWAEAVGLGLALAVVGQVGDLTESLLKRDAGVKDSGRIPGLGGILDMVDSLLLTAPLLYGYLWSLSNL